MPRGSNPNLHPPQTYTHNVPDWFRRTPSAEYYRCHVSPRPGPPRRRLALQPALNFNSSSRPQLSYEFPAELQQQPAKKKRKIGHCAEKPEWMEDGKCMCSVTWRMPGAYPREGCEIGYPPFGRTHQDGDVEEESGEGGDVEDKEYVYVTRHGPGFADVGYRMVDTWADDDVDEEEELRKDGKRKLDQLWKSSPHPPRVKRKPKPQPDPNLAAPDPETRCCDGSKFYIQPPAGDYRQWWRNVGGVHRAEDVRVPTAGPNLSFPAPGKTTDMATGRVIDLKFSERFFQSPYYSFKELGFKYIDTGLDLKNLRMRFDRAEPTSRVIATEPDWMERRKEMLRKKRRTVHIPPREREPVVIRKPTYSPPLPPTPSIPKFELPPSRMRLEEEERRARWRPESPVWTKPRNVVFPHRTNNGHDRDSHEDDHDSADDTPCPPPKKPAGKKNAPKPRRTQKDRDGNYRPGSEDDDDDDDNVVKPTKPIKPTPPNKKGKGRRRRNSDTTYRPSGIRENNRIEKKDREDMEKQAVPEFEDVPLKQRLRNNGKPPTPHPNKIKK